MTDFAPRLDRLPRWHSFCVAVLAIAMVVSPLAPRRASAAQVSATVEPGCASSGFAEYGAQSRFSISPSAKTLEVVLPAIFTRTVDGLHWTLVGPTGTYDAQVSEAERAARPQGFVIPIDPTFFDPAHPTQGHFDLQVGGMLAGCFAQEWWIKT